jgi:flagellar basal-body rod modification protein FlgD
MTGISGVYAQAATSTGSTSSTSTTSSSTNQLDQDAFLKLLVAQLKYQDPENPADATQFMSQTAQFAMVERLNSLEKINQQLVDVTTSQSAAALVGKTVTWTDAAGEDHTGVVTGATVGASPTVTVDRTTTVALDDITGVTTTTTGTG